jgi:hypothetical protein
MEGSIGNPFNFVNGILFIAGILLTLYYVNYNFVNKHLRNVYNDIKLMLSNIIRLIFL